MVMVNDIREERLMSREGNDVVGIKRLIKNG